MRRGAPNTRRPSGVQGLDPSRLFAGDGEMARLCRTFDWSSTPLGPVSDWSHALRALVAAMLRSRHPMFLFWGPELVQFYNDAYRPSLGAGERHPRALGARGREFWTEIWDIIGPQIDAVMTSGEATWNVDHLVAIERNQRIEEVYWTYSYSPALDDDGTIGGTLVVCQETTARVLAERRLRTLHALAALSPPATAHAAAVDATRIIAANHHDVPFVLCYLAEPTDPSRRELAHAVGIEPPIPAEHLPADDGPPQLIDVGGWPGIARGSPWPEPPTTAAVVALRTPGRPTPLGTLVIGVSPRLPWDDRYEDFVVAAARHIATAIEAVRSGEALAMSEARSRLAIDAARIGTWTWDLTTDVATFDDRVRELFGFEDDAMPRADILTTRVHPDDRDRVNAALAAATDPDGDGRYEAEYRIIRPDGTERSVRASGRLQFDGAADGRGRPTSVIGTVLDVTDQEMARREAERQRADLEAVLAVVPVGIGIARDAECSDIRVNPAFAAQLGIRPDVNASKSGAEGAALPFIVRKDGQEVAPQDLPMQRAAREKKVLTDLDYEIVHADGRVVRLLESAAPIFDDEGRVRGAVGAFVDVTERAELLERERHARADAEAANRAKSDFLATMSHELRTPLNAIAGYAELIELGIHGPVTAEQRRALARIQTSQRHLLGLINEVLSYTRIEAGAVEYDLATVPLAPALSDCEALTAPQLRSKELTYSLDLSDPSISVWADREKLQQIVINLLTNAIKFTAAGGEIRVSVRARGDNVVAIRVADTGRGIPSDRLHSVFEPFVQIEGGLTRTHEGVGLGLAISRDLARRMGGDLVVESTVGKGSTFTLTLPRTPSPP